MCNIYVSQHAYDRAKERLGFNKKAIENAARKALEKGIRHSETTGQICRYISNKTKSYMTSGADVRIYGENVYYFVRHGDKGSSNAKYDLITVYGLPKRLKPNAFKIQRRKKQRMQSSKQCVRSDMYESTAKKKIEPGKIPKQSKQHKQSK